MHLSFCSTVLLFATRGLRKTSSLQSLSYLRYRRAIICFLKNNLLYFDKKCRDFLLVSEK